ncbi:MAG: aminotransferase class I/II-fold pyridoxal phosphate-dependent enzyme [Chlorobium sp.]|nr:aminotransferase class I/II-fold pyridoxal phosphate-dependent enzyme [Chlorobium sp.]MCF8217233.1 aminotransferase class I/II-fold pyridoxal phosphate-dependent enzyme [Chlorobium sp.]MCF8288452.1 aminotransferase class I/II-fold pyridoxal phosphate-dependent enzyme [Chlorobium sp.]MCF8292042.1 aminotransferase class I/II-fold pyridoxal phosphate-dependent enzyme [Chlorobium sp.]MCF8386144.1 aminotransferase class I/II-fold pyridoxal phosphate-dependent enzyme [Chlorobium sp.]
MTSQNITVRLATRSDRNQIYKIRYQVYAEELGQHQSNVFRKLQDNLDEFNEYVVVKYFDTVIGFVSITPPNDTGYSIDKYVSRSEIPLSFHDALFELRLLTVVEEWRHSIAILLLVYGTYKYLKLKNASEVIAIGRAEIMSLYEGLGFKTLGKRILSGKVTYELMYIDDKSFEESARRVLERYASEKYARVFDTLNVSQNHAYHGGQFFKAIGENFSSLEKAADIINADVLDAWFDPAPEVIQQITRFLPWEIRTSPPTHCAGVLEEIASNRKLPQENIVLGAGSSDLMFRAIMHWVKKEHKVLILDPMYGEYAHILENIVGCEIRRFCLDESNAYQVSLNKLREKLHQGYDWLFIVNPNSPTGHLTDPTGLRELVRTIAPKTRVWIDETYIDYVDSSHSLERLACQLDNLVICKSLSKAYALSGLRSAYLCSNSALIRDVARVTPPWILSLPAQIGTVFALRNSDYYALRWKETNELREGLKALLSQINIKVISGTANFLLCKLVGTDMTAKTFIAKCQEKSLFLRDVSSMGSRFDPYTFRISVKDISTNKRMAVIMSEVLQEL